MYALIMCTATNSPACKEEETPSVTPDTAVDHNESEDSNDQDSQCISHNEH